MELTILELTTFTTFAAAPASPVRIVLVPLPWTVFAPVFAVTDTLFTTFAELLFWTVKLLPLQDEQELPDPKLTFCKSIFPIAGPKRFRNASRPSELTIFVFTTLAILATAPASPVAMIGPPLPPLLPPPPLATTDGGVEELLVEDVFVSGVDEAVEVAVELPFRRLAEKVEDGVEEESDITVEALFKGLVGRFEGGVEEELVDEAFKMPDPIPAEVLEAVDEELSFVEGVEDAVEDALLPAVMLVVDDAVEEELPPVLFIKKVFVEEEFVEEVFVVLNPIPGVVLEGVGVGVEEELLSAGGVEDAVTDAGFVPAVELALPPVPAGVVSAVEDAVEEALSARAIKPPETATRPKTMDRRNTNAAAWEWIRLIPLFFL